MTMRDGKDSSELVVRKKTVKDVGMDKEKVDIKLKNEKKSKKKEKKSKNNVYKCKNDKDEITVAHFSDNEEDGKLINDGNDGLAMFCHRCMKDVEKNDFCKACDDKLSSVRDKKKKLLRNIKSRLLKNGLILLRILFII